MASKRFYHDIDLVQVGQLKQARIENILNEDYENALALGTGNTVSKPEWETALGADNTGMMIYRTDDKILKFWNGDDFIPLVSSEAGLTFRGSVDIGSGTSTPWIVPAGSPNPSQGVIAERGNMYAINNTNNPDALTGIRPPVTLTNINNKDGNLITFKPYNVVETGDLILFDSETSAYVIQTNIHVYNASDSQAGIVELADDAEIVAGVDTEKAVTPAGLSSAIQSAFDAYSATQKLVLEYYELIPNILANQPYDVVHDLNLVNADGFVANIVQDLTGEGKRVISLDIEVVDKNTLRLYSFVDLQSVSVTVMGVSEGAEV